MTETESWEQLIAREAEIEDYQMKVKSGVTNPGLPTTDSYLGGTKEPDLLAAADELRRRCDNANYAAQTIQAQTIHTYEKTMFYVIPAQVWEFVVEQFRPYDAARRGGGDG